MSEKLYVPVFQFFMNDELGFAYGTTGRAYHTYDEVREFFWKGDESAKIEEVVVVDG